MKSVQLLLVAALAFPAVAAHASERVVVKGFEYKEVDIYSETGAALGKVPASAFSFPLVSTEAGIAKSVGLPYQGRVVFVRRPQLKLDDVCAPVPARTSPNTVPAGSRASMGEVQNCLLSGPDNR